MEAPKITPKAEWPGLSVQQLYDLKFQLTDLYYNMRGVNASFANQYRKFSDEVNALIAIREHEARLEALAEAERDA